MKTVALAAISLDGFMTRHETEGTDFTSPVDQAFFQSALRQFDCIVYGTGTFEAARERVMRARDPKQLRVVLTTRPDTFADDSTPDELEFWNLPARETVEQLKARGRHRLAVLGGRQVFSKFLAEDLVDEYWITIEPRFFGQGKTLFSSPIDQSLRLIDCLRLDDHVLLLKYLPDNG